MVENCVSRWRTFCFLVEHFFLLKFLFQLLHTGRYFVMVGLSHIIVFNTHVSCKNGREVGSHVLQRRTLMVIFHINDWSP